MIFLCVTVVTLTSFPRRGQGSGPCDRHGVQPIGKSAELLHGRVSAPPGPHPEFWAFD